ncbi:MAG: hypothetical protein HQK66_02660 [Desulfamplus sp.]|nr:hypothetical protein [Desulfamplus sp.]
MDLILFIKPSLTGLGLEAEALLLENMYERYAFDEAEVACRHILEILSTMP